MHDPRRRRAHRQVIIAELGPDMSRFPTHRHAASWAAICPGNDESAGKRRSGQDPQGQPAAPHRADRGRQRRRPHEGHLPACAIRAVKRRHGHKKAIVAVAHSILVAAYYILRDEIPYQDLGGDYFARRADPERITKRLVAQLERLGHSVTLQTSTATEVGATPA